MAQSVACRKKLGSQAQIGTSTKNKRQRQRLARGFAANRPARSGAATASLDNFVPKIRQRAEILGFGVSLWCNEVPPASTPPSEIDRGKVGSTGFQPVPINAAGETSALPNFS